MSINTIPFLNYEVPADVDRIYYTLGYRFKYIPYTLVEDIANVISHWKISGNKGGFIAGTQGFNGKYRKFLYSIPFDIFKETTPYYMAVEILNKLSARYDFRKIERAIMNKDDNFNFLESKDNQNPQVDLETFNEDVKSTLKLDESEYISLNIINILKATEKFEDLFANSTGKEFSRMRSYSQYTELAKYKLVLPTFEYNFVLKNFNVTQKSPKEIIIFRDISASAEKLEGTFKGLLLYFLQNYSGKTITVNEFTNKILNTYTLKSIEDIKEYYEKKVIYKYTVLKFSANYVKEFSECYIVTSGIADEYPKKLNCIVNGISKNGNKSLKLLCDNTQGKYIRI